MSQETPVGPVTDLQDVVTTPEITYQEIYRELLIHGEIFLADVAEEDVPKLKKGLSNLKAKDNNKAKEGGLPELIEDRRLEYEIIMPQIDADKGTDPFRVKVRIMLREPVGIKCRVIPADNSLN